MNKTISLFLFLCGLVLVLPVFSAETRFAWSPSPDLGVTNYVLKVLQGTNSVRVNVGTNLTAIAQLTNGVYSVVVTAQKEGVESDPSNMLILDVPRSPTNLRTLILEAAFDLTGTNWTTVGMIRLRSP